MKLALHVPQVFKIYLCQAQPERCAASSLSLKGTLALHRFWLTPLRISLSFEWHREGLCLRATSEEELAIIILEAAIVWLSTMRGIIWGPNLLQQVKLTSSCATCWARHCLIYWPSNATVGVLHSTLHMSRTIETQSEFCPKLHCTHVS